MPPLSDPSTIHIHKPHRNIAGGVGWDGRGVGWDGRGGCGWVGGGGGS